jgi:hypothetical protein
MSYVKTRLSAHRNAVLNPFRFKTSERSLPICPLLCPSFLSILFLFHILSLLQVSCPFPSPFPPLRPPSFFSSHSFLLSYFLLLFLPPPTTPDCRNCAFWVAKHSSYSVFPFPQHGLKRHNSTFLPYLLRKGVYNLKF